MFHSRWKIVILSHLFVEYWCRQWCKLFDGYDTICFIRTSSTSCCHHCGRFCSFCRWVSEPGSKYESEWMSVRARCKHVIRKVWRCVYANNNDKYLHWGVGWHEFSNYCISWPTCTHNSHTHWLFTGGYTHGSGNNPATSSSAIDIFDSTGMLVATKHLSIARGTIATASWQDLAFFAGGQVSKE